MRKLVLSLVLPLIMLFENGTGAVTARSDGRKSSREELHRRENAPSGANLRVNLRTATGKTILFKREDQAEARSVEPSATRIPHLVLNRNGVPTPGFERTLIVSLNDVEIPSPGVYVQLTIETQHRDPDLDRKTSVKIPVWQEIRFIPYSERAEETDAVEQADVHFRVTFNPITELPDGALWTPTDYFRCKIVVSDSDGNQLQTYTQEYAFLIENQWRVPLPAVLETTPGAAPNELLIYYYDMVPFQTNLRNPDSQIPRQEVGKYIQTELLPQMVSAFETQTDLWGMPWYEEWSNARADEDPKTLSVALGGYGTWFHGSAPSLGHAMISIRVDGSFGEYSNLTDGIMSVFDHELFHNQQRNISLHFGSKGFIAGQEEAWKVFSEGTAVLASSVGQPDIQFEVTGQPRSYMRRANAFLGREGAISGGLNKSYKDIPYQTALYWRFLYENCGGVGPQGENPAAGMKVIVRALEALYAGEIVQINESTDVAGAFPRILDHALQATRTCKFRKYEESLIQFARAVYRLRLEDGRCRGSIESLNCGFFDPNHLYQAPPADSFLVGPGTLTEIRGSISSSYGIDLVELAFSPSLQGQKLQIVLTNPSNAGPRFRLQAWKTRTVYVNGKPGHRAASEVEPISISTEHDRLMVEIEGMDFSEFDGLGLIITRIDPHEAADSTGAYSIGVFAR